MHLLLTDRLCCPRCGPEFGLILLAHEMRDRRIIEGELGCSNCREQYPVEKGFADLRAPPRTPLEVPSPQGPLPSDDSEETLRLAALLGVTHGPGTLLLMGPAATHAGPLADLISEVEVVGVDGSLTSLEEREGVSRMVAWPGIPFFSESLRGVLLSRGSEEREIEEAARVVAPLGRVVALGAGKGTRALMEGLKLTVLLEDAGIIVAVKEGRETHPLTPLRVP